MSGCSVKPCEGTSDNVFQDCSQDNSDFARELSAEAQYAIESCEGSTVGLQAVEAATREQGSTGSTLCQITREELAKHSSKDDCWVAVDQTVYDITNFLSRHPGGTAPVFYAGTDASSIFFRVHPQDTLDKMGSKFEVGRMGPKNAASAHEILTPKSAKSYYNVDKDEDGYNIREAAAAGRQFGDHMSDMGETSHIPTIILAMYGALAAYSWLAHWVTGGSIFAIACYYLAGMTAFYIWHTLAHSESSGEMHQIHMEHHLERFPPTDFYGSAELFAEMYPDGKPNLLTLCDLTKTTSIADGTGASKEMSSNSNAQAHTPMAHEGPLLAFMAIILLCGYFFCGSSLAETGFAALLFLVMSAVGNALHMSFHVRNFHLEKYNWYNELRALHYIHHLGDMKSNLAMLNLGMDGLFHSLAVEDPNRTQGLKQSAAKKSTSSGFYSQLLANKQDKDLPDGISKATLTRVASHAGAVTTILGLDVPVDYETKKPRKAGYPTVLLRLVLSAAALFLWFKFEVSASTSVAITHTTMTAEPDAGHTAMHSVGAWLQQTGLDGTVCKLSAVLSELTVLGLITISCVGHTFRPMLATIMVFVVRLGIQLLGSDAIVPLAPGAQMVANLLPADWPTLFVPSGAAGRFFSAKVALSAVACAELLCIAIYSDRGIWIKRVTALVGVSYLSFNVVLVLALKVSWSFDVLIAMVIARYSTIIANRFSVFVDAFMP